MSVDQVGESISDMAARAEPTKVLNNNSDAQNVKTDQTSLADPISASLPQVNDRSKLAENPYGMAEIEDTGATGEVLSGTGNVLPPTTEMKNLGASFGGREGKHAKNLVGHSTAHHKRGELQDGEDLDLTPQPPYESNRRF